MTDYRSNAMADIAEFTRPRSYGEVVDTRVVRPPTEPKPDYDQMRRMVHGRDADKKGDLKQNERAE